MLVFGVEVENWSQVQRAVVKVSYSLACHVRCKVKYFGKYSSDSERFNDESRGIQCSLMCLGLVVFVLNLPNRQVLFLGEIQITEGL